MARHMILLFLMLFVVSQSRAVPYFDEDISVDNHRGITKRPFTLKEIYLHLYDTLSFNGTWISDTEIMIRSFLDDIIIHDVVTGEKKLIFDHRNLPMPYKLSVAKLSADRQRILFCYNYKMVFRHSTIKNCAVYDMKRDTFDKIANEAYIMVASWLPVGSDLIYVQDYDIYHMTFNDNQNVVRRLTHNGEPGTIYNGIPDWVYEEEVFSSSTALWYSPNGQYLAFATFNDTAVKDIVFQYYGEPGSLEDQYPTEIKIKYPKAGTPNPEVTLWVIDLTDPSSKPIILKAPVDVVSRDHVLFRVSWWDSTQVMATWTNRVQNRSQLVIYDTQGTANLIFYDEETEGWLQPNNPVRAGDYALLLRREESGGSAGRFQHIMRYEYNGSRLTSPVDLTPVPSEVQSILAADSQRGRVYYLAMAPGEPSQRNLYMVPLDGSQKPTCISCEQLTPEGKKCVYVTASFSRRKSHYAVSCLGPGPVSVLIMNEHHQPIIAWQNNTLTRKILSRLLMPIQKNLNITVNGYDCRVRLFLPPDFNENKTYAMLVHVYAGPNSIRITDATKYDYEHYMTTNRRVIYAWIDGRGSANKGSKMLFEIYRRMGTVEVEDTIAITAALQQRYSWIDAKRTGIWGWSYGGFTTSMVLATDTASVFKCGISVAPVTSWIYYDSIYTERFMGLPTAEDNLKGYYRTDVSRHAKGIRGKKFMLIHGTADDNVHYQQAMALSKSLEERDILFEQVTYPDEVHSLFHVYPHFYHTMDKFWTECFDLK